MKQTRVINIDYKGITEVENLITNNPKWELVTGGQTSIANYQLGNSLTPINFLVFQSDDEDLDFREDFD